VRRGQASPASRAAYGGALVALDEPDVAALADSLGLTRD
jgi:hypothetical protein